MHFELLVEEPSSEAALTNLIPKIVGQENSFALYPHEGKMDLLSKLPHRLRGYSSWLPRDWRIVVLLDLDKKTCVDLKRELEDISLNAGLTTKSSVASQAAFQVLNRIAIEELEAWFFGDVQAVRGAYPRISASLGAKSRYRNPDHIAGGTWEALERELQRVGYFPGGLEKVNLAREISLRMDVNKNRSKSFQVFREGLLAALNN